MPSQHSLRVTSSTHQEHWSMTCSISNTIKIHTNNNNKLMFCNISKTIFKKSLIMSKTMHSSVSRNHVYMQQVPEFNIVEMQNIAEKSIQRYAKDNVVLEKRNGKGVAIVWFRNDLRVHDNEALFLAWESSQAVLPVYCVDPRLFQGTHHFGFPKTGATRGQFLMECLTDLKRNLQKQGLDLLVQRGKPEELLPSLATTYGAHTVYAQKETCSEELNVEKMVTINLEQVNLQCDQPSSRVCTKLKLCWGSTMYHIDDLPFDCTLLPDMYTQFRKSIESKSAIRNCIRMPMSLGPPPDVKDWGCIPDITELGLEQIKVERGMKFIGGESAALSRVFEYFWTKDLLKIYKDTRNGMLGPDYSTKFSPWLASGSLSPRLIYEEVKRYEKERVANSSTYWVLFELIWRDYFRFLSIKEGNSLFLLGGPRNVKANWSQNQILFDAWKDGQTGYPLVDANMKELSATGFMSNRGRQIVCSFLVRDMGIDWRMGAEWFESCLLDYDPCSNYGNWTYGAGVGNDPREDRYFSIPKQAQNYDPEGEYVSYWLPKLRALPKEKRHFPGMSYIKPVVALRYGNTKKSNAPSTSRGMSAAGGKSNDSRYKRTH